ncbi:DNA polymerase I [Candidatus Parcubacteria bacterium]|nr:DNA polymerase I [Patescibacteria group bacterium]MBU4309621.1 DNA polymerase I [Patescibacteria group bacterium]MBU4432137.1 DNA polymerase I [Patescibacteria group bacterium]MBU4577991.1 DNA polymerase I [Patescibacteria group bacterium]MCG2696501.1 DNA polymerase I [Candidatus Parcubacteria bacterium]
MIIKKEKIIIIDGNALIHRSFHALPPTMKNSAGEMTNAVYGFTTVLLKAIKEFKPEYVVVTLDRKAPTFRHIQYTEYKAHREKAPDELYAQIPMVKKVVRAFGIPIFEMDGFEADDLIGTITRHEPEVDKIIVTGDADAFQLVRADTKVYTMSRGILDSVLYDEKLVEEKYGLKVAQLIDYKALRGDTSDNIPGVKGIGEKTATELLKEFGNLDELYKNLDKVKPRIAELLKTHKEDAYMSKELATIKLDVPMDFNLEAAKFGVYDKDGLVDVFSDLGFKSLLPRVADLSGANQTKAESAQEVIDKFERNRTEFKYVLVDDEKKFAKFFTELKKQKAFAVDTETTSLDPITCEILGVSFSWKAGEAYYLKLQAAKKKQGEQETNLFNYGSMSDIKEEAQVDNNWLKQLKPILEDVSIQKYGHNMKYDVRVLKNQGVNVEGINFDTMIASYLLNPDNRQHNLDAVVFAELGFVKINKEDLLGKGKDKIEYANVEAEKLSLYACEDADFTFRLVEVLRKQLQEQKLETLFNEMEMPLISVLVEMEENGISLDGGFLQKLNKELTKKIDKIKKEIWTLAGGDFNINSTKQLKEVLFDKLQISAEGITKTKTGFSTAFDELEKMKDRHEIIKYIQEYRELAKLISTYIEALPQLINPKTKRIHTSYNQAVAATGRLSSTEPNLQNIPVRTEMGREIRKAFVAKAGYMLVAFDYSQIELRVAAHMSGDETMLESFKNNVDIHSLTAAKINEVDLSEVTSTMRREAKAINFGILYGQGPHGLAQATDISFEKARLFIEEYFKKFPGVKNFIDNTIAKAKEEGFVETMFGRRRFLADINSSNMQIRKAAERMAVNTPIQGTAADLIKKAMIEVLAKITDSDARVLLQVHDELIFEMREDLVVKYVPQIKAIMENAITLTVPIVVDAKVGQSWGEMEKI